MTYKQRTKKTAPVAAPSIRRTPSPIIRLLSMLEFMRPAGSVGVDSFINEFLLDYGDAYIDPAGNVIVHVGDAPNVLWSSHTDTVHAAAGFQRLAVNGDLIKTSKNRGGSCLGADCTTGVWIMSDMIKHGVDGLYVFHADEEIGGHGSQYIANKTPDLLTGIDFAIAFDRRGTSSIITHQSGLRCASDAFADSIAPLLPHGYKRDDGGSFTDTLNYIDHVAECSNVSVGYENAHTVNETQSISHAIALRDAMLRFDASRLVKQRVAGERDPCDSTFGYWRNNYGGFYDDESMFDYVFDNTNDVADFLQNDLGFTVDDLRDHIEQRSRRLLRGR